MYYVIQENVFKETHVDLLIQNLEKFKFDYEIVKFRPFCTDIEFNTDRKDIFCFGSVSMAHAARKYGWTPGSMYNENHDYEVYAREFGYENMLNGTGKVMNFIDPVPIDDYIFFARPTKDTKIFTGQIFTQDSWREYAKDCIDNKISERITAETKILVAPLRYTRQEVRCWVVGGKVVTTSRYRINDRTIYENYDHERIYWDFAQSMVDKYQPAEAFVIDVALMDDGLKVVEINCFNCSGFYHANVVKMIEALEDHFNPGWYLSDRSPAVDYNDHLG